MFGDNGPSERRKLLKSLSLAQLDELATANGVDTSEEEESSNPLDFSDLGRALVGDAPKRGKALLVDRLDDATRKVPISKIRAMVNGEKAMPKEQPSRAARTIVPLPSTGRTGAKRAVRVELHDVVSYLEAYQFISRYAEELNYEVELAGALRERFGTVVRQNPVAVPGKRLTIDLDVGGVGIEVKFAATAVTLRNAVQQLQDYKHFYDDRLVLLLIGTPGQDQYKNDVRNIGAVLVEKS